MQRPAHHFFNGPEYSQQRAFWQRQFDEAKEASRLTSVLLCEGASLQAAPPSVTTTLCEAASREVWKLSKQSDLGVFAVVAGALALLMGRLTNNEKVAMELPLHKAQPQSEKRLLVVSMRPEQTIKDLLLVLAKSIPASQACQEFPVREFAQTLGVDVASDVLISSEALHGGVEASPHHAVTIQIRRGAALELQLSSASCRMPDWLLTELGELLGKVLTSFGNINQSLASLQDVAHQRVAQQLSTFNKTEVEFPTSWLTEEARSTSRRATVIDLFERRVAEQPEATAVICQDVTLSYAALDEQAQRLATHLASRFGVGHNSVVASLSTRSHWAVVALFAILKAGATFLPVNSKIPSQRMSEVLSESGASVVVAHSSFLELAMDAAQVPLYAIDLQLPAAAPVDGPRLPGQASCDANDLAYILYTSGTTGVPKGVMVAHGGLTNTVLEHIERFAITSADRYLQFMAMSFDGFLLDAFTTLCAGAALVIADEQTIEDPDRLMDYLERHGATISTITPSYLQLLDPDRVGRLRILVSAGEAINPSLAGQYAKRLALYNGYGPSEATINATLHRVDPSSGSALVPIGRPGANKQIFVVDDRLRLQPIGVVGEICIAGEGLAKGYLGDPDLTAQKFVECPFKAGSRMYRTGDLGAWTPEGVLLFKGRRDNQVKVNGLRVDLHEIEHALQSYPDLRSCHLLTSSSKAGRTEILAFYQRIQRMELVPSLGEYGIYDVFLYESMATDKVRVEGYRRALAGRVEGQVVLDPGTGSQLILARHCVAAGAARVYAIEIDDVAFREAKQNIRRYRLEDKIVLIKGDIASVPPLPEPVDVIVSALAGNIASADGCIPIVRQLKRLVSPGVAFVPDRYCTKIAGFDLSVSRVEPGFSDISSHYIDALFQKYGRPFDFRLCVQDMAHDCVLTDVQDAEDIRYNDDLQTEEVKELTLKVHKHGCLSGMLLWLNAFCGDELMIDSSEKTHHLPVYLPLFGNSTLDVSPGDEILLRFVRSLGTDELHPDYHITGLVRGPGEQDRPFHCDSPHSSTEFRGHRLYAGLLSEDGKPTRNTKTTATSLRTRLQSLLPAYMVPHRFVEVRDWPLTPHGKVDGRALLSLAEASHEDDSDYVPPANELEALLCRIWTDMLELRRVSVEDNFFSLGCDSIRVIQAVHKAREEGIHIDAADVMAHQTVRSLAAYLKTAAVDRDPVATNGASSASAPVPLQLAVLTDDEFASVPVGTVDAYPASAMQLLMLDAYEEDRNLDGVYHCCALWHIDDTTLSEDALVAALQHLYDTQPSLRTRFLMAPSGRRLQAILVRQQLAVPQVDLRDTGITYDESYFRQEMAADIAERFCCDAAVEPLIRFKLWRTSDTSCVLLFCFHHAILDGWSGVELRNALIEHYVALKQDQQPRAHKLPYDSRKEFVALEIAASGDSNARRYWEQRLAKLEFRRALQPSHLLESRRTQATETGFATHVAPLPLAVIEAADQTAQRLGVTLKSVFLHAVAGALMAVLDVPELALGVVMNGRSELLSDPLRTTGLFWNILPLVADIESNSTVQALHDQLNEIEPFSNFPLLEIERQLLGGALCLPSFNFVNFHNVRSNAAASLREGLVNDRFHFPLNIFVALEKSADGPRGTWRIEFDRSYFNCRQVESVVRLSNRKIASIA